MIIYNITTKVSHAIENVWLQWQKEEHIPEIMLTGLFTSYQLFRLLEQDDDEGSTYIIQYTANTMEDYQGYIHTHAHALRKKAFEKWADQFISFRSVLEVMH
jgi:Domain of unknown function (DUF4286)